MKNIYDYLSTSAKRWLSAVAAVAIVIYGIFFYLFIRSIIASDPLLETLFVMIVAILVSIMASFIIVGIIYGLITLTKFVWNYVGYWSLLVLLIVWFVAVYTGWIMLAIYLIKEILICINNRRLNPDNIKPLQSPEEKRKIKIIVALILLGLLLVGMFAGHKITQFLESHHTHTYETVEAVPATCTRTGLTEGSICSQCGEIGYPQKTVPKIDCVFIEDIEKQATLTEDGIVNLKCEMCHKISEAWVVGAGSQGLIIQSNEDGTHSIISIGECTDVELVIPKHHNNLPITALELSDLSSITNLSRVTMYDNILTIGDYAFYYCAKLENVEFGENTTYIGYNAFQNCISLQNIVIPSSVTQIGESAFFECTSLHSITLPNSLDAIPGWLFYGCETLTEIHFEGTVEEWNALDKGYDWDAYTGEYTVYCTNGAVAKND